MIKEKINDELDDEETLVEFKIRLNKEKFNSLDVDIDYYYGNNWHRPRISSKLDIENLYTRYEVFVSYIKAVDYGENNNPDYVAGHVSALNKYLAQAEVYNKNIVLLEKELRKEPQYYRNGDVYEKGYQDGLKYVMNAVVKSKQVLMEHLNDELKKLL